MLMYNREEKDLPWAYHGVRLSGTGLHVCFADSKLYTANGQKGAFDRSTSSKFTPPSQFYSLGGHSHNNASDTPSSEKCIKNLTFSRKSPTGSDALCKNVCRRGQNPSKRRTSGPISKSYARSRLSAGSDELFKIVCQGAKVFG